MMTGFLIIPFGFALSFSVLTTGRFSPRILPVLDVL